jgi:hypothetical protein
MASISLADQLDDAIEMMIAEPDSALPKVDPKIHELLGIAAELRLLPDPEFKAALKAELVGQNHAVPTAMDFEVGGHGREQGQTKWNRKRDEVLPSLLGKGYGN